MSEPGHELLYYCPASYGGIADYAHAQATALVAAGMNVTLLGPTDWPHRQATPYTLRAVLRSGQAGKDLPRWRRRFHTARRILQNQFQLAEVVGREGRRRVLCASYIEYLAPLWAGRLRQLARRGTVFGAVVHDPVRDTVVGPVWWHRRSVAAGYSYLRDAFMHHQIVLDTVQPMQGLRTTVIPIGPFVFPAPEKSREAMRRGWDIPATAPVLLSFGLVRDGKNLDLMVRALAALPEAHLVVAGTEAVSGNKPVRHYQQLAESLGVAGRCRWVIRFIPAGEVGNFFTASDVVMLTYSAGFRSASAVLNTGVHYQRPCLASSGESNLGSMVREYGLGVWVEPDDPSAVVAGLKQLLASPAQPRWEDYARDNSWERNAALVQARLLAD
jgi:glycosyltransferase involved in cell wall biosynthesis